LKSAILLLSAVKRLLRNANLSDVQALAFPIPPASIQQQFVQLKTASISGRI
jgi:hypothetical protein